MDEVEIRVFYGSWTRWFAWKPVYVREGRLIWFKWIYRRAIHRLVYSTGESGVRYQHRLEM